MTWDGRRLATASKGTNSLSYTYNADGIRTSKTVDGLTTEYLLNGTQILAQKTGDDVMWFYYDSTGTRVGMSRNGYVYYYIYNLQGDVIALARATTGNIVATYSYDAWGNCTVNELNGYTVGSANPFRYRSYYYDSDTGLYYLNTRYYDTETGRFINADSFATTDVGGVLSANTFSYCENNPVMRSDPTGELFWDAVGKMAIGAAIGATTYIVGQLITGNSICAGELAISAGEGALTAVASTALGATVSGIASGYRSFKEGNNLGTILMDSAIGIGTSLAGSGSKRIGASVKLSQFKNTATKRELKALGNSLMGTHGNQYKHLANWSKPINQAAKRHFMSSSYANYMGYLGSCGTSITTNIIRSGARGPR